MTYKGGDSERERERENKIEIISITARGETDHDRKGLIDKERDRLTMREMNRQ